MQKIISSEKLPIKLWLDDIEEGALRQAKNLANLDIAFSHIAIMPDCHEGFGMPIGGVLAALDAILPNAVGVDIGCGMCAVKTNLESIEKKKLSKIIESIKKKIPLGFEHHKEKQDEDLMPANFDIDKTKIVKQEYKSALKQLGTLGGGNHFIEIQKGSDGFIWIMLHSGSRNIGLKVADYYNKLAIELASNKSNAKIIKDLCFFEMDSQAAQEYFYEMQYCVEFALANRKLMLNKIQDIFFDVIKKNLEFSDIINIAHNYAVKEVHFGKEVIVHRKGATRAFDGEIGIIPGSQGSKSYIVSGLGNSESFMSCSHGAGRKMGRNEAIKKLDLDYEIAKLNKQGIIHGIKTTKDLDEASGAYKDIRKVMENQSDLVNILVELKPLAVVKG